MASRISVLTPKIITDLIGHLTHSLSGINEGINVCSKILQAMELLPKAWQIRAKSHGLKTSPVAKARAKWFLEKEF